MSSAKGKYVLEIVSHLGFSPQKMTMPSFVDDLSF
jgi:hypothetical protein